MMLLALAAAACIGVAPQADRLLARDLAPAFPAFSAAPPDAIIGFAPAAGAVRTFSVGELARIAAKLGIPASAENEICVERPVTPLTSDGLLEAMRRELPNAKIEIVDFSRIPAPAGELEFRAADLHPGPAGSVFWHGSVRYAGGRRFPLWAKVKVSVNATRVIAVGDLAPGQAIGSGMIVTREEAVFPTIEKYASSPDEVVGRRARIAIRAGASIRLDDLQVPQDVLRGETVRVIVQNGAARLELDAIAEASGSVGARIPIRNPNSYKIFLARVDAKGTVSVDAPSLKGIE